MRTEYGQEWAYGACDGGYYDCDNNYVPQGYIAGNETFHDDYSVGYEEEEVHWSMDSWTVSFSSCNNGNPSDTVETSDNTPYDTSEFEVFCG